MAIQESLADFRGIANIAGNEERTPFSQLRSQRRFVESDELSPLFADLGVNYKRDAEIYHIARLESGLHQYGGWFHFIGNIVKQPIGPANPNHFTIDFVTGRALAAKAFENQPLVQIEITAEIPWALSEKEID